MNRELVEAVKILQKEKGIDSEKIYVGLENSLLAACKGIYGRNDNIVVSVDRESGDLSIVAKKEVVEDVLDTVTEINLIEAQKIRPRVQIGDVISVELDYRKFGRIAAQNAKNIMLQTVREEEKNRLFDIYKEKQGTLVTGIIQKAVGTRVTVNIGKIDAILPEREQLPNEIYTPTKRMKFYIADVKQGNKEPRITVSRTRAELVMKLFEQEVVEIKDGIVEIKNITREAGSRTKISVYSNNPDVDPVGSCVGLNVARINAITEEINGEKIDIINWNEDPEVYIENALAPANVVHVMVDSDDNHATVVVPDYQLSLAIGKEGQNVRLAAHLTGYRIDIYSETQFQELLNQDDEAQDEISNDAENYEE